MHPVIAIQTGYFALLISLAVSDSAVLKIVLLNFILVINLLLEPSFNYCRGVLLNKFNLIVCCLYDQFKKVYEFIKKGPVLLIIIEVFITLTTSVLLFTFSKIN